MPEETLQTYPPLNRLKPVADDVWIIDGPLIRFGPPLLKMPFSTRATIVRLEGAALFVHSPTPLAAELRDDIGKIGSPRWIIAPNRLHHSWISDWHAAYPDAEIHIAPGIERQAGTRLDFDVTLLERPSGYGWDSQIATLPITGSYMTEIEFFHRPSRTLLLTDLIENFEPQKLETWMMQVLTRIGGVQHPNGSTPRDLRMTFSKKYLPGLRAAVEQMIEWNPERVVLAHGRWYESNGQAELRRALGWVLDR